MSSTFSYVQEAKSNAIMNGFKNMVPKKCKALRDGAMNVIDASELVPGDIVEFQDGDQVPADLRVTFAYNLKVSRDNWGGSEGRVARPSCCVVTSASQLRCSRPGRHTCPAAQPLPHARTGGQQLADGGE